MNNTRLLTSYNLYIPVTPFNGALRYKTEFFVVLYQLNRAKVKKDNTSFDESSHNRVKFSSSSASLFKIFEESFPMELGTHNIRICALENT